MPHVALVPFTGLRCRESEMLELGMSLPGLAKRAQALSELPALGLLTLAGMTPADWNVSYHPSSESGELIADVLATKPDVVAISCLTASALEAYEFSLAVRDNNVPTVIGGLHATAVPPEASQFATSVCVGDGESSWLEILNDVANSSLQAVYRPRTIFDVSQSPLPRFDLLGTRNIPRWTLQTQRGCPFACEFCAASRLLGPNRFKTTAQIEAELQAINAVDKSPWIELADDNTWAGRDNSIQLLETLEQSGGKYFTESDWRIGRDPRLVDAMAQSGCVQVLIGLESLPFRYPGMGKKRAELDQMLEAIETIQAAGIVVNGCFIIGADGETHESLDRLIAFINSSPLAEVQLTLQTPFPGTKLHDRMKRDGRLIDRDWSHYTLFDVVFQPDQMSVLELETGVRRVMSEVFSSEAAGRRDRLRRKIWSRHPRRQRIQRR